MSKNLASVSSKEELTERLNYALEQIRNGQTVTHSAVVAHIKKLKASIANRGNDTNPNRLHIN